MIKKNIYNIILFFTISNTLFAKQNNLNVLFCLRQFPTNTAFFIINQMVEFIKQGHNISIYTQIFDENSININHPDIVKYKLLKKTYTQIPPEKNYDVILCQSAFLAPDIIKLKKQGLLSGKLIMFVRESFKGKLIEMKDKIFNNVDLVMPVCEYFKNKLIELGCDENKIIVLHSAIDLSKFPYTERTLHADEPIQLLSVNRLNEKKGVHYVIHAIKTLIKDYPNIQYTVLGDGNFKSKIKKLIKELKLKKHVHLVGWQTPEEVSKKLAQAHIFILASSTSSLGHEEGIPNALMEACASGLPVISTFHAGIPELIKDKISGYLVPEKTIIPLAETIKFLILHSELWNQIGKAGRNIVEKEFDRDVVNNKLIEICQSLIENNKS